MALGTPAAARALLTLVAEMEIDLVADDDLEALLHDPDWLLTPPMRRHAALRRFKILRRYDRKVAPTKQDALVAAGELGMRLRSFYALLRDWRDRGRSALALVPYRTDEAGPRSSRLDPEVARRLTDEVRLLVEEEPGISPGKAVRAVAESWPEGLRLPSGVTIRAYVDRERTERAGTAGALPLGATGLPDGGGVVASRFGEVVVVDRVSPARLLLVPKLGAAVAPTITLAIDLWSGTPLGAAVGDADPDPAAVLDALADAAARMEGIGTDPPIRPSVVYVGAQGAGWDDLRERFETAGLEANARPRHRLPPGASTRSLVGSRLGTIHLQGARGRRPRASGIDLDQEALLTMNQMMFLVDASVEAMIRHRLPEIDGRRGVKLDLPTAIADRGSLRSRVRPLIEITPSEAPPSPEARPGRRPEPVEAGGEGRRDLTRHLQALATTAAGSLLAGTDIREPSAGSPGWVVRVEITDPRASPDVWLRLARGAIELADAGDGKVRFDVVGPVDAGLARRPNGPPRPRRRRP